VSLVDCLCLLEKVPIVAASTLEDAGGGAHRGGVCAGLPPPLVIRLHIARHAVVHANLPRGPLIHHHE
jgi:hypothetical protein